MADNLMSSKERITEILKSYTKKHNITASSVILEEYAEELLANGVIPLPCKFQQKVYVLPTIENNLPKMTEMKCIGFIMSCDSYNANLVTDKNKLYQPCFGDFGKTVFLTKEEAEAELEKRGKENA